MAFSPVEVVRLSDPTKWRLPHLCSSLSRWDGTGGGVAGLGLSCGALCLKASVLLPCMAVFCTLIIKRKCLCEWQWWNKSQFVIQLSENGRAGQLSGRTLNVPYLLGMSVIWAGYCMAACIHILPMGVCKGWGSRFEVVLSLCARQKGCWCASKTWLLRKLTSWSGCVPESTPAEQKVSPHLGSVQFPALSSFLLWKWQR